MEQLCDVNHVSTSLSCLPTLRKSSVTVCNASDFELGEALTRHSYLLEFVFKYLDAVDLNSTKLINTIWKEVADRELKSRLFPGWIYFAKLFYTSAQFTFANVAICLIAFCPSTIKFGTYLCVHDADYTKFQRITFAEYINKEIVPTGPVCCALSCTSICAVNTALVCKDLIYQGIYIPYIPNIRIAMFYAHQKELHKISANIKSNEQVKSLLVFSSNYRAQLVEPFYTAILKGQPASSVAMGGGITRSSKIFEKEEKTNMIRKTDLLCIAFLQEESVEAHFNSHSRVIFSNEILSDAKKYELFENEVIKFKESVVLREHGMLFRFCCYSKKAKEREMYYIKKYFPNYAIFGVEVDGEIGWNTDTNTNANLSTPKRKKRTTIPESIHGWSTVLVVITWGKLA